MIAETMRKVWPIGSQMDCGSWRGVLHGVPLAVKDVTNTTDMPTTHGSPLYAGNP